MKGNTMEILYTAEALSTGAGRNGHVRTSDGQVDLDLAMPKEMGGSGNGANPEDLFAAGYAACFHSALQGVARSRKIKIEDSSVGGRVSIGPNGEGGFQLAVMLEIVIPGIELALAQELADAAHQVCPYSNATRGNIDVQIVVEEG
jgi:Ohr subfamily peroxiredoxin